MEQSHLFDHGVLGLAVQAAAALPPGFSVPPAGRQAAFFRSGIDTGLSVVRFLAVQTLAKMVLWLLHIRYRKL